MNKPIPVLIVPTLNGHDRVLTMLKSIDYPVDQVIIIDNANVGWMYYGAIGIESRLPNMNLIGKIHTIHMPSNLGVAASWNLGIKATPMAPWWLIVNDDVTFPANSLAKFANYVQSYGDIVIANTVAPWSCFAITDKVINIVGLFDEAFYPAYFEDTDYARRVRHYLGEDAIGSPDIKVNHANSSTIADGYAEQNHRTYQENYRTFEDKLSLNRYEPIGWSLAIRRMNDWGQP